jgi:cation diffusion facilitator family transporter
MKHDEEIHHDRKSHEHKTKLVAILTAITMVVEIGFGYYTNSMALLADGWHMSSHAFALGLTWVAYIVCRKYSTTNTHSFNQQKLLALTGFSSAIILQIIAVVMAIEAVGRLINPIPIKFGEAIFVAFIGLLVNALSAFVLHHEHEHSDHNIRAAYVHVLADGLTSITAILALLAGMYFNFSSLDAISGIIGSLVITKWSITLIRDSGKELIDFKQFVPKQ